MEKLEGRSLDVIMRDPDMSFTEEDIWRLALHMLSALEDLHRQNIIHRDVGTHRDVKPSNIVLCDGDYNLVDIGAGDPENVGPCSDVYALSATLYLLISGQMPFRENNEFEWIIAVAENMEEQAPRLHTVCPRVSTGCKEMRVSIQQFEHDRFTRPSHWTPTNPVNECRSSQSVPG
jgi:serine/threonine protein kinase